MPNYRRTDICGGTYFFTVNTWHRQPVLTDHNIREAMREAIRQTRQSLPFVIDAWVLLPDHLHCIWTLPEGDDNYSARWAIIKRYVSKCYTANNSDGCRLNKSRTRRRESGLWQRRFWEHLIRDREDFNRHLDYIHWNPVKHGYAATVREWPYSSFHRYVKQAVYPLEWGGAGKENESLLFGECE